jgi:hypothetical protein
MSLLDVGMKPDGAEESKRVENRMHNMMNDPPASSSNFWSDRTRAFSLAVLQERVGQVQPLMES